MNACYQMVGGMPAVVVADAQGADAKTCRDLERDLLDTYPLLNLPH